MNMEQKSFKIKTKTNVEGFISSFKHRVLLSEWETIFGIKPPYQKFLGQVQKAGRFFRRGLHLCKHLCFVSISASISASHLRYMTIFVSISAI